MKVLFTKLTLTTLILSSLSAYADNGPGSADVKPLPIKETQTRPYVLAAGMAGVPASYYSPNPVLMTTTSQHCASAYHPVLVFSNGGMQNPENINVGCRIVKITNESFFTTTSTGYQIFGKADFRILPDVSDCPDVGMNIGYILYCMPTFS